MHPDITIDYQRIAIFGAGLSGRSARSLAVGLGAEVCIFDEGGKGDAKEFNRESLEAFDAFVFSPGFAAEHPWRVLVEHSGKPCFGELGFAASHWRGRLIGITGTNGKTTLTALLCEALKSKGIHAIQAGNIGMPLSDFILSDLNREDAYAVCEISSFQAELKQGLQLDRLIWSNFAEDHLNRYATMSDYFKAKANLLKCRRPGAPAFIGESVRAFDASVCNGPDVSVVKDRESLELVEQLDSASPFRISPQSINLALVAALWRELGFSKRQLLASADVFQLAAHRLSRVAEWDRVVFWNDSKATNFHAALAALDAMDGRIYWIAGGSYKGGDLGAFVQAAAPRVKRAFLYGAVADQMADHFVRTGVPFEVQPVFTDAVAAATGAATADAPAIVLLSPGFASFDQFSGYSARGNAFIETILKLQDKDCPD